MNTPEPEVVLPLLDEWGDLLYDSLRGGIDWANDIQPDAHDREQWFWAHSCRYQARKLLLAGGAPLHARVPNAGIHFAFGVHKARVLRSLAGSTPHPGRNPQRRADWRGIPLQQQLAFPDDRGVCLPPLSLIIDWWDNEDDEPVIHVGLPFQAWEYSQSPRMRWRVPLPHGGETLSGMSFDGGHDGGEPEILRLDPSEQQTDTETSAG